MNPNKLTIPIDNLINLTTLKICCKYSVDGFDFENLCENITKMSKLLNLTILESQHIFCHEFSRRIISKILSQNFFVMIKASSLPSCIKQMTIFSKIESTLKSRNFNLIVKPVCLENLYNDYFEKTFSSCHIDVEKYKA